MKTTLYAGAVAALLFGFVQIAGANDVVSHKPVCEPGATGDVARCHAQVVTDKNGKPAAATTPSGYGPLQLRTAYGLTGTGSPSQVIAVVDAYDDPNIAVDLNTYSAAEGIPTLPACTGSVSGSPVPCFKKVDQRGGITYPAADPSWALEESLDVEVAHAICTNCSVLLVEANSNSFTDLFSGVNEAVALGAKEISNSYGSSREFSGENSYDSYFNHPGIAITVSSGDAGYGTSYPAASPYVTSVGGTTLTLNADNTYHSEAAWSGSGSGCSSLETKKPAGQPTIAGCTQRMMADVSADADPSTGAAVYDSLPYQGRSGWFQVGGTSLSSPLIAAVYALAGGVSAGVQGNTIPYAHVASLRDVKTGKNGNCGKNTALCTAVTGFDGPTGLGSPSGTGAF